MNDLEPFQAGAKTLRIVCAAPQGGDGGFDPSLGWKFFRDEVCGLADDPYLGTHWQLPRASAPCLPVDVRTDPPNIRVTPKMVERIARADAPLAFWVPDPLRELAPSLRVRTQGSYLYFDEFAQSSSPLSMGRIYVPRRPSTDELVDVGELQGAASTIEPSCALTCCLWTEPLVLKIDIAAERNNRSPWQKVFWNQVAQPAHLLDIEWQSTRAEKPRDALMMQFLLTAGRATRPLPVTERSAVQRLVFGSEDVPSALWFVLLDNLGGTFRLRGFLTKYAYWEWCAPPELPYWADWMATVACQRAGLRRDEECSESTAVPPSPFRAARASLIPSTSYAEEDPVQTIKDLRAFVVRHNSPAAMVQALVGGKETTLRFSLLARLLPRSRVLVELPPFPITVTSTQEMRDHWDRRVRKYRWLDLVDSPPWPEVHWLHALLGTDDNGIRRHTDTSWDPGGAEWHPEYYNAIHTWPMTDDSARWSFRRHGLLQHARLGRGFILGKSQPLPDFEPFVLR